LQEQNRLFAGTEQAVCRNRTGRLQEQNRPFAGTEQAVCRNRTGCLQEENNIPSNLNINHLDLMSIDVILNIANHASI
jgi:hypothetical protein